MTYYQVMCGGEIHTCDDPTMAKHFAKNMANSQKRPAFIIRCEHLNTVGPEEEPSHD